MRSGTLAPQAMAKSVASIPRSEERSTPQADSPEGDRLEEVRALMLRLATGPSFERLGAIVQEHLYTGGKKLRARLALSAVDALGGEAVDSVGWAAACELLHNATLIHDDLQDSDPLRRGHYTVWVRHGQAQAINAGDLLLMLPFIALEHLSVDSSVRWELARAIARRAEDTVRGQSLEMCLLHGGRWDWASYAEAAMGKTSALMVLPVHGAALLSGRSPEAAAALGDCFRNIGLLFQIQDDVIDLYGDKGRGKVGGDIREGRVTALVAEHLRLCPADQTWLIGILSTARDETSDRDVEQVARRFERSGALAAVFDRLEALEQATLAAPALLAEPRLAAVAKAMIDKVLEPVRPIVAARRAS